LHDRDGIPIPYSHATMSPDPHSTEQTEAPGLLPVWATTAIAVMLIRRWLLHCQERQDQHIATAGTAQYPAAKPLPRPDAPTPHQLLGDVARPERPARLSRWPRWWKR